MVRRFHAQRPESVGASDQTLGRWARLVAFQLALGRFCARRLREHDVMSMSAALCYRTIFTMIPVIVLGLLVAKSLGTLDDSKRSLRTFLEASGFAQIAAVQDAAPATSPGQTPASAPDGMASMPPPKVINLADEIEQIVTGVEEKLTFARIGPIGGALLIWTAVGLLAALEQSLNRIFGAPRSRSAARRLLLYWSALTLGPVTLAVASYLGRSAIDVCSRAPGVPWLLAAAGWIGPIVVGVLLLAALYKLLPNTAVRWSSAIGGAAVATVLWLAAKWAFAYYVERLVLSGNLYGMLGVLPLFLLWLYYSWLILLFGAEFAHTAVNLTKMRQTELVERVVLGPSDVLAAAVAIAQPYAAGRGPVTLDEVAARLRLPPASVQGLVERLARAGLICATQDAVAPRYVPARPAAQIPMLELLDLGDPRADTDARGGHEPELAAAVGRVQCQPRKVVARLTLRDALGPGERDAYPSGEELSTEQPPGAEHEDTLTV
ncbi:MAG: YhjD/YihY/BrkB family envelope integrity protein [Planctomycetota bacterium]